MAMTPPPPYQDLLRAVGQLLDREGWRDIALAEAPDGLSVRGTRPDPAGLGQAEAELFLTLDDLARLHREGRRQRGQAQAAEGAGYQARLRAVGWLGEVAWLRGLRVLEAGEDLLLEGRTAEVAAAGGRRAVSKRLTPADIAALRQQLCRLRRGDTRHVLGR